MKEERFYLVFDDYEKGITIRALNELRNKQIQAGRPTAPVDELIGKVVNAPVKKMKVVYRNETR